MKLQDTLDQIREGFAKQAPSEAVSLMHDCTRMLQRSGLTERSIQLGDTMPDFNLTDTDGQFVSLGELIEEGPLVISFFRGFW